MKEFLKNAWYNFFESGIPSLIFFVCLVALIIWKPAIILWILAAVGIGAIITIIGANFTGG